MKRRKTRPRGEIGLLLHLLDEAYEKPAWHGRNLKGSLRGVSAREAAWRPGPGLHNIREVATHAAYWKHRVRRRLIGESSGSFPLEGSNWFNLPAPSERVWRSERDLLESAHRALRETVRKFPAARLASVLPGMRGRTALREIAGIALHDAYHTGQIQLLKVLQKRRRRR